MALPFKDIEVGGNVFRCDGRLTVREVIGDIRDFYSLKGGGILSNETEVHVPGNAVIGTLTGALSFVGGRLTDAKQVFDLSLYLQNAPPRPLLNEVAREFALYKSVAESLAKSAEATTIRNKVDEYRGTTTDNGVFMVIEAPSGSGKSQLPFVLQAMEIRTVHVVMQPFSSERPIQPIYRALEFESKLVIEALNFDAEKFKIGDTDDPLNSTNDNDPFSRRGLQNDKDRAVVRVIVYLLGDPSEIVDAGKFTTLSLQKYVLEQKEAGQQLPVFCIDEAMSLKAPRLRYLRNVFRAVGLLVVLMGTDSTAANLVGVNSGVSRGSDVGLEWCHVVTRLPRTTEESLSALGWTAEQQQAVRSRGASWASLVDSIHHSHATSNPLFVRIVIDALMALSTCSSCARSAEASFAADLDGLLETARIRIYSSKSLLTTQKGLVAQLCLHSNWYRPRPTQVEDESMVSFARVDSSVFISHHFAIPTTDSYSLYLHASGRLRLSNNTDWANKDAALFAPCGQDPWLYLLLGGGKHPQMEPFQFVAHPDTTNRTLTTNAALTIMRQLLPNEGVKSENSVAIARDGDDLELLGALAMIVASRWNGVGGTSWWDFVCHLITHLTCDMSQNVWDIQWKWDPRPEPLAPLVDDWVIPFLGPLNSPWPDSFRTMNGVRFGNAERSKNSDRLDFKVIGSPDSLSFTGECKNYSRDVEKEKMMGILARVPADALFHVVVVSTLQKSYTISRSNLGANHATSNVLKTVVNRESRTISLAPAWEAMDLVPWESCTRLVLFVEEGVLNSPAVSHSHRPARSSASEPPRKKAKTT